MIDVMESVEEKAQKHMANWVIECALMGCTLVPSMKSVGEIASEIWPIFLAFGQFLDI